MFAFIGTLSAHADSRNIPCSTDASGTVSVLDCLSSVSTRIDPRDVFDAIDQARSSGDGASSSTAALSGSASTSVPSASELQGSLPGIPDASDLNGLIGSIASSTSGTSTQGMGSAIAEAVTGASSGGGTSDIGPFIKCVLLANMGWPIPTYSTECNTASTTPNQTRIIIVKNTINGNGTFSFSVAGVQSATTSITTAGNTGSVQFIVRPGSFTIAEDMPGAGWTQSGRGCTVNATSTGSANGTFGWQVNLSQGDVVTCVFTNTASTTPGGGGGCTENCGGGGTPGGGGGCTENCGGGGTPGGSSGSGGAGGGNGPIVMGGGGFSPGEVLGNTIDLPAVPGIPNTGAGDPLTRMVLTYSGVVLILGLAYTIVNRKHI
jgi:hypothetical protein